MSFRTVPVCRRLRKYDPFLAKNHRLFFDMFSMFEAELREHEATYDDGAEPRDFTDAYIRERRRADDENDTGKNQRGKSFLNYSAKRDM